MSLSRRKAIQALMAMPAVASIETLQLKVDDALVIQCDGYLSQEAMERITQTVERVFPGQRCLILGKGMSLKVVKG